MKTCKTHCKWCSHYWYAAIGLLVVIALAVFGAGRSGKTDVTTACKYDVGISGTSSIVAGSTAAFDVSIYPVNCTTEGDTSISITTDSTAAATGAATMPSCTPETSSVHLTTSGVVKTKINCSTSATTANGYYMYYANFSPVNGATPTKTWFNFSVTGGNEPCSGFNMSTDKSSYAVNEAVTVKYSCVNGKPVDSLKLQVCWPNSTCDEKSEILYTAKNVSGGSFTFPIGTNYSTNGSYLFRTCMYNTAPTSADLTSKSCPTGSTNSVSFNVTGNTTATTNSCTSLSFSLKDNKTTYSVGDMVNYSYSCVPAGTNAASVAIHLIKPDGSDVTYVTGTNVGSVPQQMGFSTSNLTAGSYTLKAVTDTGSTYSLPFTITGGSTTTTSCNSLTTSSQCSGNSSCYWATKKSGTSYCAAMSVVENCTNGVDDDGDEYIDKEDPACSNTVTTCPSGQYLSGGTCVTNDTTTSTACAVGAKCPSNSWCQNGQSFYYSTGELTCVAWSNDGTQPQAPAGTSACRPSDTNCMDIGQTLTYVSGKWCARGMSYYSKDKMTCVANGSAAPTGFSSCRPDDSSCIPTGSYGPSSGYCSNGMTFYQKVKDTNANNDKYCAEMPYMAGTTPMTNYKNPEPPAGYGSCEPSSTGCKEKGDKWSDSSSTYWCQNSQKCNLSGGGGTCVGWNESCPSGSKYCSATDTYCVEPGETKDISASTTTNGGYSSYWCGGGGGMVFYSATKAYCEPRKADNTMTMMWTAAEVKAILTKLGAGWGLCPTKTSSSNYSSTNSRCLEPGQTGSSSDWCGWWPPSTTGGYYNNTSATTRTCPALDDTTKPVVDPIVDPIKEICPMMPTVSSCPAGQIMIKVEGKGKCGGYNYCKPDKEMMCPTVEPITSCPAGQTLIKNSTPSGCPNNYCVETVIKPMPFPEFDRCQTAKQQARGYKYEIKQFSDSGKYLPEGTTLPEDFITLLKSAREGYDAIDKLFPLGTKVVCTEELGASVQAQINALRLIMDSLREKAGNVQAYMHCIQFQKELNERIKMLTEDVRRMRKSSTFSIAEELAEMKDLSAKTPAICKEADQYTIQDLYDERQDIEESISDKFNDNANTARDTFVTDTIYDIRNGMAEARQQIADKNLGDSEQCQKVENLFTQVETFIAEAQRTYDSGNEEEAGQILDKIFRFEEPVMLAAEQCGIDLDIDDGEINREVYSNINNLSNEQINEIVDKIVERTTERFTAILDEKIKQLTARIAQVEVSDKTQEQLDTSVTALQAVPKETRTDTEEAKNATLDTMIAFDKAKDQIKADLYARVRAALERATALNLFGESAEVVKAQAVALKLHAENGDVTSEDVVAFEQALTAAEKQNTVECYRVGGCRFRDIDPSTWYYSYLQNSTAFKGESDADGNRTGNVGPGRSTLRAEALVAIERTAGISGVDRPCELTATGVRGVPAYANCAVNIAVEHGITFNGSLSEAATRDEVASWMVAFEKDNLPVEGSSRFTGDFRDMGSCRDTSAVSYIVANKIMTGYGGDRVGTWGCGQPLLRAELAAVLSRLEELLSLTRATPVIMD